jgi:hypothetical protein
MRFTRFRNRVGGSVHYRPGFRLSLWAQAEDRETFLPSSTGKPP